MSQYKVNTDLFLQFIAWCLRNENVNCVLIAPTSVDHLYTLLHSLKASFKFPNIYFF